MHLKHVEDSADEHTETASYSSEVCDWIHSFHGRCSIATGVLRCLHQWTFVICQRYPISNSAVCIYNSAKYWDEIRITQMNVQYYLSVGSFLHVFCALPPIAPEPVNHQSPTARYKFTTCFWTPRLHRDLERTLTKASLLTDRIIYEAWWSLPKNHLAAQIFKVWFHVQRHPKIFREKFLSWNLHALRIAFASISSCTLPAATGTSTITRNLTLL